MQKSLTNPKGAGRKKNIVPNVMIRRMISKENADWKPSGKLIDRLLTDYRNLKGLK